MGTWSSWLLYDDIYDHSLLQRKLKTPICLDESIKTAGDLRLALQVGAINILNLKPRRVIFNPGSENYALVTKLKEAGIEVVQACTLVMLRTEQF